MQNGDTVQEAKPAATPSVNMMSDIVVDSPQKVLSCLLIHLIRALYIFWVSMPFPCASFASTPFVNLAPSCCLVNVF